MTASSNENPNPDYTNRFLPAGGVKLFESYNSQTTRLKILTYKASYKELGQAMSNECTDSHFLSFSSLKGK